MAAADVAANVVGAVTRMLRRLFRFEVAIWGEEMARQGLPPGDIDAALAEETSREAVFARRSAERVAKAVRLALASTDPSARAAAFQAALRREQHYARYRAEAMAGRLFAAVEREALRRLSPTGAFWELSPFVAEHTPDCLAMGNKFWPWEVLDRIHPPLHAGCPCRLRSFGEAVSAGLMSPGDVPTVEQARRLSAGVLSYLEREERAQAAALAELDLRIETVARGMLSPDWGAALPLPPIQEEGAGAITQKGAMVALYPTPELATELALRGGEKPEEIHMTLAFLGPDAEALGVSSEKALDVIRRWASETSALEGTIAGEGVFRSGPKPVTYLSVDLPELPEARERLIRMLDEAGIPPNRDHGFTPHMTLDYASRRPKLDGGVPVRFERVTLAWGGERLAVPLGTPYDPPMMEALREEVLCGDLSEDAADAAVAFLREASARGFAAKAVGAARSFDGFDTEWDAKLHPRDVFGKFIRTLGDLDQKGSGKKHTAYLDPHTRVTKQKDGTFRVVRSGPNREGHYGASGFESAEDAARAAFDASAGAEVEGSIGGNRKLKDFDDFLKGEGIDPDAPTGDREHLEAEVKRLKDLVDNPGEGEAGKIRRRANKRRLDNFARKLEKASGPDAKFEPRFGPEGDAPEPDKPEPETPDPDKPEAQSWKPGERGTVNGREAEFVRQGLTFEREPTYTFRWADGGGEFTVSDPNEVEKTAAPDTPDGGGEVIGTDRNGVPVRVGGRGVTNAGKRPFEVVGPSRSEGYIEIRFLDKDTGNEGVRGSSLLMDPPETDAPAADAPEGPPELQFDDDIQEPAREAARQAVAAYHEALPGLLPSTLKVESLAKREGEFDFDETGVPFAATGLHDGRLLLQPDAPNDAIARTTIVHELAHGWDKERGTSDRHGSGKATLTGAVAGGGETNLRPFKVHATSTAAFVELQRIASGTEESDVLTPEETFPLLGHDELLARAIERHVAEKSGDTEWAELTEGLGPVYWGSDPEGWANVSAELDKLNTAEVERREKAAKVERETSALPPVPDDFEPSADPPGNRHRLSREQPFAGDVSESTLIERDAYGNEWRLDQDDDGKLYLDRTRRFGPLEADGTREKIENREVGSVEEVQRAFNAVAHDFAERMAAGTLGDVGDERTQAQAISGTSGYEVPLTRHTPIGLGDTVNFVSRRQIVAIEPDGTLWLFDPSANTITRADKTAMEEMFRRNSGHTLVTSSDRRVADVGEEFKATTDLGPEIAPDAPPEARALMEKIAERRREGLAALEGTQFLDHTDPASGVRVGAKMREALNARGSSRIASDPEFLKEVGREAMETGLIPSVHDLPDPPEEAEAKRLEAEIADLNERMRKRIEALQTSPWEDPEFLAMKDELARLRAERGERDDDPKARAEARKAKAREVAAGFRKFRARFGLGEFSGPKKRGPTAKAADDTADVFPAEWVDEHQHPEIQSSTSRAHYRLPGMRASSRGKPAGPWGLVKCHASEPDTMVHEFAHYHEHFQQQVLRASLAFRDARAQGERPRWLGRGYGRDEIAVDDLFIQRYMGKVYTSARRGEYASEILSMGMERLFFGKWQTTDNEKVGEKNSEQDDPEYDAFVTGVLLAL